MTKTAKTITYAAGIFTAFWLIIAFLITSVEAVTYWTPGYYEKEYTKYQVLNDLPEMTMDDLLDVTDEMMAFLRGKRENLHVYTTMGGEYREFFNDREIAHMEDVRGLFIGGLWLRRIGILITLCFASLAYFWGRKSAERTEALKRLIPKSLCIGTGAVFAVDTACFHRLGDFDPYTFLYYEEYILSARCKAQGIALWFDPTVTALHCHGASAGGAANLFTRLENLRSELYFLHRYRHWSRHRLATVRRVRCLEVLFTFGKAHKWADARTYLRKSKILLKKERTNET